MVCHSIGVARMFIILNALHIFCSCLRRGFILVGQAQADGVDQNVATVSEEEEELAENKL